LSIAVFASGLTTATLAADLHPKATTQSAAEYENETGETGELTMSGIISKIDLQTGKVKVETLQGTAKLYFASESEALRNLKVGDKVMVEMEIATQEAREHKK